MRKWGDLIELLDEWCTKQKCRLPSVCRQPSTVVSLSVAVSVVQVMIWTTRGLGYVHGASLRSHGSSSLLSFFGETADPARWSEIEDGWRFLMHEVTSRVPGSGPNYSDERTGLVRGQQLVSTYPNLANALTTAINEYGDPDAFAKLARIAFTVRAEEVDSALAKVFSGEPATVFVSRHKRGICTNALSVPIARKKLQE